MQIEHISGNRTQAETSIQDAVFISVCLKVYYQ